MPKSSSRAERKGAGLKLKPPGKVLREKNYTMVAVL